MKLDFLKKKKATFKLKESNLNPNVYWITVFFLGLLLTLCAFGFGFYMFAKVEKIIGGKTTLPETDLLRVNKPGLSETIEHFNKKSQIRNNILNTDPEIIDPSV